jgi:hypothetical protein
MIKLFQQAMAIWLPDLPVIPIVQAPALVPFNSTYWTNWPTAENAWNMPVSWWANLDLVLGGVPNPETGAWEGGVQPAASSYANGSPAARYQTRGRRTPIVRTAELGECSLNPSTAILQAANNVQRPASRETEFSQGPRFRTLDSGLRS